MPTGRLFICGASHENVAQMVLRSSSIFEDAASRRIPTRKPAAILDYRMGTHRRDVKRGLVWTQSQADAALETTWFRPRLPYTRPLPSR